MLLRSHQLCYFILLTIIHIHYFLYLDPLSSLDCSVGVIEGTDAAPEYEVYTTRCSVKLRMSRSFGDFPLKKNLELPCDEQAVISVPDVVILPRSLRYEHPALPPYAISSETSISSSLYSISSHYLDLLHLTFNTHNF
jgi:hypothetical protein